MGCLGALVRFLGSLVALGCLIIGFVLCVRILNDLWGAPIPMFICLLFSPLILGLVPLYEGLASGDWGLFALVWGGLLVGQILNGNAAK